MDKQLLQRLRCPITHGPLEVADQALLDEVNRKISSGGAKRVGGEPIATPIQSGLVDNQRNYLYPLENEIATLIADEAIELRN